MKSKASTSGDIGRRNWMGNWKLDGILMESNVEGPSPIPGNGPSPACLSQPQRDSNPCSHLERVMNTVQGDSPERQSSSGRVPIPPRALLSAEKSCPRLDGNLMGRRASSEHVPQRRATLVVVDALTRISELLDRTDDETVGTSMRIPAALREAAAVAVAELGVAPSTTALATDALRSR